MATAAKAAGHPDRLDHLRVDLFIGMLTGRYTHLSDQEILAALHATAPTRPQTTDNTNHHGSDSDPDRGGHDSDHADPDDGGNREPAGNANTDPGQASDWDLDGVGMTSPFGPTVLV